MSSLPPPPPYSEKVSYPHVSAPTGPMPYPVPTTIIFGPYPATCKCPHCGQQIVTRIEKKAGSFTWLICAILFFTFLWFCCFIPFCIDSCKDTEHYCPSCGTLLGGHKQL